MKVEIIEDELGFKTLKNKPSRIELQEYYTQKYFNQEKNFLSSYSKEELLFKKNKLNQKFLFLMPFIKKNHKSLLELGSGEGWVLKKFKENNFKVIGIDYSGDGLKRYNNNLYNELIIGDVESEIINFDNQIFDIIWIENVLEHVLNPRELIENIEKKLKKDGLVAVTVPNDFSILQKSIIENKMVNHENYWLAYPDHISYFNYNSLINIFKYFKFELLDIMSDYPIEFDLLSQNSNYIDNKNNGQFSHQKRIKIENLLSSISDEKTNQLYRDFAELGIGRSLFAIFKKK